MTACTERCTVRPDCLGQFGVCQLGDAPHEDHLHWSVDASRPGEPVQHTWRVHLCVDCGGKITPAHPGDLMEDATYSRWQHRHPEVCLRSLGSRLVLAEQEIARLRVYDGPPQTTGRMEHHHGD